VTKNVIILEDCNAINYLISTVLEKDYNITSVKNCAAAMSQLQSEVNRDLIIVNIPDAESDNFELLKHISTSCVLNNIQRVVISDSDDMQLKRKTAELGATLFITKPFDPVYLSEKVREIINLNEDSLGKKRRFSINMNIF
jgi:response regulator RpfG family c-di-GMP phosphodiesterase